MQFCNNALYSATIMYPTLCTLPKNLHKEPYDPRYISSLAYLHPLDDMGVYVPFPGDTQPFMIGIGQVLLVQVSTACTCIMHIGWDLRDV